MRAAPTGFILRGIVSETENESARRDLPYYRCGHGAGKALPGRKPAGKTVPGTAQPDGGLRHRMALRACAGADASGSDRCLRDRSQRHLRAGALIREAKGCDKRNRGPQPRLIDRTAFPASCHCEPARTLAWQSVLRAAFSDCCKRYVLQRFFYKYLKILHHFRSESTFWKAVFLANGRAQGYNRAKM